MLTIRHDIWALRGMMLNVVDVCIGTNIGWKADGENVMGRGLAKQAASRYTDLPASYGQWCGEVGEGAYYYKPGRVWCIPSKPLNPDQHPWLSWQNPGSLPLVEAGLKALYREFRILHSSMGYYCLVPLIGAGNAGLQKSDVRSLIERVLGDDHRFILVLPPRGGS